MKTSTDKAAKGSTSRARYLRSTSTPPEAMLWRVLRNRQLGVKFRRQVPVGPYIADFLSLEIQLIVEVDGAQHGTTTARKHDQRRDRFLRNEGYEVIRLWGRDVMISLDACLVHIGERVEARRAQLRSKGDEI